MSSSSSTAESLQSPAPASSDTVQWDIGSAMMLSLLTLVLVVVYWPSLEGPFAFDDHTLLELSFPSWNNWLHPETRPLVTAAVVLERLMFGDSPTVHRGVNVFIHLLSSWVLFDLVRRCAVQSMGSKVLSTSAIALAVTAVWALHPLHTECVAYIVQRSEAQMGLFYFAFLNCLARYQVNYKLPWAFAAIACFALGLWSKTVIITALAVAPMMDRAFFQSSWLAVVKRTGWIYGPPWILGSIAAALLLPGIMVGAANVGFGGYAPPLDIHLAAQAEVWWHYLALAVWPWGLSLDHGIHPPATIVEQWPWITLTVLYGIVSAYIFLVKSKPIGFCLLTPLIVLSPTSSVVPTADLMVEHRLYVPLAPLAALFVVAVEWSVARLWVLSQDREQRTDKRKRKGTQQQAEPSINPQSLAVGVISLCAMALAVRTYVRASDYASAVTLWKKAVLVSPDNDRAIQNLVNAAGPQREARVVIPVLQHAIEICQRRGIMPIVPMQRMGEVLSRAGDFDQAEVFLAQTIELDEELQSRGGYRDRHRDRERAAVHTNLALIAAGRGDLDGAYQDILSSIEHFDDEANARAMAGDFARRLGKREEAIEHFSRALELRPGWQEVESDLRLLRTTTGAATVEP